LFRGFSLLGVSKSETALASRGPASRTVDAVVGVDLGMTAAATLSSGGEKIAARRPLKAALRRLRIRSRRQSRTLDAAKAQAGIAGRIPKGTRLPVSKNRTCGARALARLHARIARCVPISSTSSPPGCAARTRRSSSRI
jgi:hypothetical protein